MADKFSFINDNQSRDIGGFSTQGLPVHEEYNNYIRRWKFYINSYLGGTNYRQGQYLTRYVYETDGDYMTRIATTPLDNHVKSVVHIYNSFLYRQEPRRFFGSMQGSQEVEQFLKDADLEGRSWQSFMRDVNIMSSVYGHCVVLVDRPDTVVGTRAEELAQGIRPYATLYTPENVIDWKFERLPSGHYELAYIRLLEKEDKTYGAASSYYLRTWTKEKIILQAYYPNKQKSLVTVEEKVNNLGVVPAIWCYAARSPVRGVGVSDVGDCADLQNAIYSEYSEIEQLVRLTNHPTLVKTPECQASAGAGSIITMPPEIDPGLKPYILQPSGGNLEAILNSIDSKIKAIDRIAHMGAIRAIETRQMSGVAMQSEFLLLDAKLSEKAKNLELFEEQFFRLFAKWQGMAFDGEIKYPVAFHIRDKNLDIDILQKAAVAARDSTTASPEIKAMIDAKLMEVLMEDPDEANDFLESMEELSGDESVVRPETEAEEEAEEAREQPEETNGNVQQSSSEA